jgi:hypothetical protein
VLQLKNPTGLAAAIFLSPDPDGVDTLYAVVKGTFALAPGLDGAEPPLAPEQVPVALAPEYGGDPLASSLRVPSDVSLVKPATDVLLVGHAYAPHGRATTCVDVSLAAGSLRKTVRVVGDRVWLRSGLGPVASEPAPFTAMPLVWERAFGGTDVVGGVPHAEARNPVGAGYREPDGTRPLDLLPLPNLEDPASPVTSPALGPTPACFAPISEHWAPRRHHAGTYDEAWQRQRAPYLPADFDPRFFQLAPPDQIAPGYSPAGSSSTRAA